MTSNNIISSLERQIANFKLENFFPESDECKRFEACIGWMNIGQVQRGNEKQRRKRQAGVNLKEIRSQFGDALFVLCAFALSQTLLWKFKFDKDSGQLRTWWISIACPPRLVEVAKILCNKYIGAPKPATQCVKLPVNRDYLSQWLQQILRNPEIHPESIVITPSGDPLPYIEMNGLKLQFSRKSAVHLWLFMKGKTDTSGVEAFPKQHSSSLS